MLLEALDCILPPAHPAVKHFYLLLLLFSRSVMSDSLLLRGLQHARFPCPSLSPGICSNSYQLTQRYHPTISSCRPLLLLLSIFASIRVFSKVSALHISSRTLIKLVVFVLPTCAEWRPVFSNSVWWFSQWGLLKCSTNLFVKLSLRTTWPSMSRTCLSKVSIVAACLTWFL